MKLKVTVGEANWVRIGQVEVDDAESVKIEGWEDIKLLVHETVRDLGDIVDDFLIGRKAPEKTYCITEYTTGLTLIRKSDSPEEAISEATYLLNKHGKARVKEILHNCLTRLKAWDVTWKQNPQQ